VGTCIDGRCVQCAADDECPASQLDCRRARCTEDGLCATRALPTGSACAGGFCNAASECVECALDENCGSNGACVDERCGCKPGFVANRTGPRGCSFDECARDDDHRCGWSDFGSRCVDTDEGHECGCDPPWKAGSTLLGPQCYQGGGGATVTIPNGGTWNAVMSPALVCANLLADPPLAECPRDGDGKLIAGQVSWVNLCGFGPPPCMALSADGRGLGGLARLQRATYSAPLEEYGDPAAGPWAQRFDEIAAGDVFLVETLTALGVMRIVTAGAELTFEWATIWRDHCRLPGGATCLAECNCEGGS
jgi:hypothetical protein